MKKHTSTYYRFFDFPPDPSFQVPCEICGNPASDIHHIEARGMGGSKTKDNIENLMALCRECHEKYGDKKEHKGYLQFKHNKYIDEKS